MPSSAGRQAPPGFIALSEALAVAPADRWVRGHRAGEILTEVNSMLLGLDLALAGLGRIVMPVYAGMEETGLVRLSGPIAEIAHEEWLVCHAEARADAPIRRALKAVERLLARPRQRVSP